MGTKLSLPNRITIFRIILIPVFIALLLHYRRVEQGQGEMLRYLAIAIFGLATISDAIDGYVARKLHQRTELGAFLDPMADKLLLNSAVIIMCLRPIGENYPAFGLPLWYAVVIFSRDLVLTLGVLLVSITMNISLKIRPVLFGKMSTILNMAVIVWVLLRLKWAHLLYYPAGVCTCIAGLQYLYSGFLQVTESESK